MKVNRWCGSVYVIVEKQHLLEVIHYRENTKEVVDVFNI